LLNRAKQADKLLRWETDSENQFVTVNGKRTFIYDNMKAYDIYTKNRQKILNEIQKEDDIFYNDPQNGINNILGL
jgi:outer membrane lipoprotein-sorting protein